MDPHLCCQAAHAGALQATDNVTERCVRQEAIPVSTLVRQNMGMNATMNLPPLVNTSQLPKLLLAAAPCSCRLPAAVQTHANALCCCWR